MIKGQTPNILELTSDDLFKLKTWHANSINSSEFKIKDLINISFGATFMGMKLVLGETLKAYKND